MIANDEAEIVNALELGEHSTRTDPGAPVTTKLVGLVTIYPFTAGAVYTPGRMAIVGLENRSDRCSARSIEAHGFVALSPHPGSMEPDTLAYNVIAVDESTRVAASTRRAATSPRSDMNERKRREEGERGNSSLAICKHAPVDYHAHGP